MDVRTERKIDGISFSFVNTAVIAAGEAAHFQLPGFYEKYKPFNAIMITNNSNEPIRLVVNDNDTMNFFVPSNTIISSEAYHIHRFTLTNEGAAAIAADELHFVVSLSGKKPEDLTQSLYKGLKGWLFG